MKEIMIINRDPYNVLQFKETALKKKKKNSNPPSNLFLTTIRPNFHVTDNIPKGGGCKRSLLGIDRYRADSLIVAARVKPHLH